MQLNRILVAVKPWQRGLPLAANHARQLAQLAGAAVQLVGTVFDARAAAGTERGDPAASVARDRALRAASVDLERLADSLRDWGASVTTRAVWGVPPYEGILAAAREWRADLVVVGTHERDLHARLTDTDWQLMRRAECPLLLVKSPSFSGYGTIVTAVDPLHAHDEPYGLDRAVLDAGRSIARACESMLRVVYAYPGAEPFGLASAVEVAPGVFYGTENVEAVHRRAVNELAEQFGVAANDVDLVAGHAPEVIVDTAAKRGAQLVVVGAPRRRGALVTAIGRTAEMVASTVACDVLIVPAPVDTPAKGSQVG